MGTVVEITVAGGSEERARAAIREALAEIRRIDDLMTHRRPENQVSLLNREGSSRKVFVEKEIFDIVRESVAISASSGGAFDITILPLVDLWGFDRGGIVPTKPDIEILLTKVGYNNLFLGNNEWSVGFMVQGMSVDLGAIAKGYAVDRAIEKIKARGIRNAIVDAGGDIRVIGGRPGKNFWRIGVQHPRDFGKLLATFDLSDVAVATSGDYERFFTADGVRYHHILDPSTGYPARGCQSVTVLASTAMEADACATAAFVLGPEKGLAFLRARSGVNGLIVDAAGGLHWTDQQLERAAQR